MKINEVEALAGITKKNIRFYEDQGLIAPRRNAENGYREYSQEDVDLLLRIRLLRKLNVPIGEIRQMLTHVHTLGDGMRRHLVTLEREQRNLQQSMELCHQLSCQDIPLEQLNAPALLSQMEEMEQSGTSFPNAQAKDIRAHCAVPVMVTVMIVGLMIVLSVIMLREYRLAGESLPLPLLLIFLGFFSLVGICAVLALIQRIRELQKGEMDDAKKY